MPFEAGSRWCLSPAVPVTPQCPQKFTFIHPPRAFAFAR